MGLPVNDKNKGKKGNNQKNSAQGGSKFIGKPSSKGSSAQRPHKAGGTRGS
jgi:hypothetical protein